MDEREVADELTMTPEERAYAAREVQVFLKHDGLKLAFLATEARITRQWRAAGNPLDREMCWHKMQAFLELRMELRALGDRPVPAET